MDLCEQVRVWVKQLSSFRQADEFQRIARESLEVPNGVFFNDSRFTPLREAWAAGQLARAIERRQNVKVFVRLVEDEFPDFVLKVGVDERPFEFTEALGPERKRGMEFKQRERNRWHMTPYRPALGEQDGPLWIGELVKKKHTKSYAEKPHLLVYASFEANWLEPEAVAAACREWSGSFRSVWILWSAPSSSERPAGLYNLSLFDSEEFGAADRKWHPVDEQ